MAVGSVEKNAPEIALPLSLRKNAQRLSAMIMDEQYRRNPFLKKIYTEQMEARALEDVVYHLKYLSIAMENESPKTFLEYMKWAKVLMWGLDIPDEHMVENLVVIKHVLTEEFHDIPASRWEPYIDAAIQGYPKMNTSLPPFINDSTRIGELAKRYLDLLLSGERKLANELISDLVKEGWDMKDIYMGIFQTSQLEVGRLWQTNSISVSQEHYITSSTQLIMSQLYPYIFSTEKKGLSMVGACVGDELHEMGIRMVTDIFELEGWDTYFLGANTPIGSLITTLEERKPELLALSVTLTTNMTQVSEIIDIIRNNERLSEIKIMVGGFPFNIETELWKKVGSDGYASNAVEAVKKAEEITAE